MRIPIRLTNGSLRAACSLFILILTAHLLVGGCNGSDSGGAALPPVEDEVVGAPSISAVALSGGIEISWASVPRADRYRLYWSASAGVTSESSFIDNVHSPFLHTAIAAGDTGFYRLSAFDEDGEGALSAEVWATRDPDPTLPPPQNLVATAGIDRITLTWEPVAEATAYDLCWGESADITTSSARIDNATSPHVHATDAGTTRYYRVLARNSESSSELSNEDHATAISAGSGVVAVGGNRQVSLSWDEIANATSYLLYYNLNDDFQTATSLADETGTSYLHSGLMNGTSYYYWVFASIAGNEDPLGPVVSATPSLPAPELSATPEKEAVSLNWNDVLHGDGYTIYWSTSAGVGMESDSIDGVNSPYLHSDRSAGAELFYRVAAKDGAHTSPLSDEVSATPVAYPVEETAITVSDQEQQTFVKFGVSASNGGNPDYKDLPVASRNQMTQLLWGDGQARILRLWANLSNLIPSENSYDLTDFKRRFLESGYAAEAKTAGCSTILFAPSNIPDHLRKNPGGGSNMELKDDAGATEYGELLAGLIIKLHVDEGFLVDATGVQNEPSSRVKFTPQQFMLATKALRAELDTAGEPYTGIAIIVPENASVDGTCDDYVDALKSDETAWAAVDGLAAHSYNMALKEPFAGDWLGNGMPYWNTEAGNTEALPDGGEAPFGRRQGASLASRALNDIRYGCTHWIWFLGYERASDTKGDQHRLIRFRSNGAVEVLPTYHYFAALCNAFVPGSKALGITADPDLGHWSYGRKPRLYVAAARHPDDSVAIAVSNYSSPEFTEPPTGSSFYQANAGYPAAIQRITLTIAGASAGDNVSITRVGSGEEELPVTTADGWVSSTQVMLGEGGTLTLDVGPMELVTVHVE